MAYEAYDAHRGVRSHQCSVPFVDVVETPLLEAASETVGDAGSPCACPARRPMRLLTTSAAPDTPFRTW